VKGVDEREVMIVDTGTDTETNTEGYVSYMNTFNIYAFPFFNESSIPFEDKTNVIGTGLEQNSSTRAVFWYLKKLFLNYPLC